MSTPRPINTSRAASEPAPSMPHVSLPSAFTHALNEIRFESPAPGEVWRLEFQGTALPVVVLETAGDESELVVAPIGEDPEQTEAATVRLPAEATVLDFDLGVWLALEHRVPAFVADRCLGSVDEPSWTRVVAVREALRSRGETLGDGPAIRGAIDPRLDYRAALEAPLLAVANAAWSLLSREDEPSGFWSYLQSHGVSGSDLREEGFENHQLRALREDRLILTPDELSRVARIARRPLDEVVEAAPRPPAQLVVELHTPRRREQLQESGLRHGNPPATERGVAQRDVCASAMRTTGGEPDWSEALDQWFTQR